MELVCTNGKKKLQTAIGHNYSNCFSFQLKCFSYGNALFREGGNPPPIPTPNAARSTLSRAFFHFATYSKFFSFYFKFSGEPCTYTYLLPELVPSCPGVAASSYQSREGSEYRTCLTHPEVNCYYHHLKLTDIRPEKKNS